MLRGVLTVQAGTVRNKKQSGSLLALSPPYVALVLLGVTGQSPNLVAHPIRRVRELPDRRN